MKIRICNVVAMHQGQADAFSSDDDRLTLRVEHDGRVYELGPDRHGRLQLRSIDGFLVIRPQAANLVLVDSENP